MGACADGSAIDWTVPATKTHCSQFSTGRCGEEGAHFDLPIALSLLIEMGVVSADAIANRVVLGELALDESIQ